jgi:23S rRNA (cytidine1920-2'-O)/16S rRNA (cytidine1409-2'-O)-methyltransferase
MSKQRLDLLLLEKNLFDSRQKAQAAIMAGIVRVGDKIVDKPGTMIKSDEIISLTKKIDEGYVSRGGLKLEKALAVFNPVVNGRVFLDIGASTGGFTHCLLKNGASSVYAIDVGYGQIDWALRQDSRVRVIERCNARYLKPEDLYSSEAPRAEAAVIDVSFISLNKIIPAVVDLLEADFFIITLVKPQFEAGKGSVKKGVVNSPEIHREVLENFKSFLEGQGLFIYDLTYSPVKGPSGNIEFLALVKKGNPGREPMIDHVIAEAHAAL